MDRGSSALFSIGAWSECSQTIEGTGDMMNHSGVDEQSNLYFCDLCKYGVELHWLADSRLHCKFASVEIL